MEIPGKHRPTNREEIQNTYYKVTESKRQLAKRKHEEQRAEDLKEFESSIEKLELTGGTPEERDQLRQRLKDPKEFLGDAQLEALKEGVEEQEKETNITTGGVALKEFDQLAFKQMACKEGTAERREDMMRRLKKANALSAKVKKPLFECQEAFGMVRKLTFIPPQAAESAHLLKRLKTKIEQGLFDPKNGTYMEEVPDLENVKWELLASV